MSSDEQLARGAARGEQGAFEAIFRRYHQDLFRFCLAMVGSPEDAQDALQNTMVKVLRALPGEERQIELRPWLYRIARNESIETLRRRRDESELEPQHGKVAGPTETAETRARLRQLIADLEGLPERQRAVLVMRELAGLSYAEIAATLESSEGAARQTLYEARINLRQLEAGREMDCEPVMKELSDADGRVTKRREIQAHLRDCPSCRAFQREIERRHGDLAALAPLPVAASTGLLHSLLAEQAGAAATVAGGMAGSAGALGGAGGTAIATSAVVKSVAAVAMIAAVGVGVGVERGGVVDLGGSGSSVDAPVREGRAAPGSEAGGGASGSFAPARRRDDAASAAARGPRPDPGVRRQGAPAAHAAPVGAGGSASGAGASPPGGGLGRSSAENGGRPASLPAAAAGGQETAQAKKPAQTGRAGSAGPARGQSAPPPKSEPSLPATAKPPPTSAGDEAMRTGGDAEPPATPGKPKDGGAR